MAGRIDTVARRIAAGEQAECGPGLHAVSGIVAGRLWQFADALGVTVEVLRTAPVKPFTLVRHPDPGRAADSCVSYTAVDLRSLCASLGVQMPEVGERKGVIPAVSAPVLRRAA